jgi:hypothetical protein
MKAKVFRSFLVLAVLLVTIVPTALAHPGDDDQHGPLGGHLLGTGAYGNIDLVSKLDLTQTEGLVADVAISPDGQWAFLAHWGSASCSGVVDNREGGAWVVDISDVENPVQVGFIAASQDSRPGEGMQVANITTSKFSGDILVMNNEHCGKNGRGGVSLWDVTNPRSPRKLSEHFGDHTNLSAGDTNDIHSAFAWDAGDKAYAVTVDNFETTDVDILDITNPKRPRLIRELDLDAMFPQITQTTLGLVQVNLHDVVVKQINGNWIMLLSYWDGGFVQLNVNNPANPTFIGDTNYNNPDPELLESAGVSLPPEGNGHQAEFTADNQYFIGTDEDFAPFGATQFAIAAGYPNAGTYPSVPVPGSAPITILADDLLNGPVVYGGYGCPTSAAIPSPSSIAGYEASLLPGEEKIIVLQRGPTGDPSAPEAACFPGEKAHQAVLAGWEAVLFVNRHVVAAPPEPLPFCGSGAFVDAVVGVCTTHEAYHLLFNQAVSYTYPDGPAIGTVGSKIESTAAFDGWGYVHLFSNTVSGGKFAELDTYAIDEAHDPAYATGFGTLSVHEVATSPVDATRSYLAYYNGGLRALEIQGTELVETGGYLDPEGNDFWGVETFVRDGCTYIAASDRDSGLWLFRDSESCS